jgi:DNA-binding NarL/FixJ family response regulator
VIKILLADDQPQVRSALRLLLEQTAYAQVVGEAANASDLLDRFPTLALDTILIDWELPGLSPTDGLSTVRKAFPSARIVALSSRPEAQQAALHAGADAFVCKGDPPEVVLEALDRNQRRTRWTRRA